MKADRIAIAIAVLLIGYLPINAQELPEIISPSPTISSLMNLEEVPVSHYTGQPNISIPIYSKSLNKDLSLNIGLQYSTLGIRVDELSGWTGTGWALSAGGVVSRTVRGGPDEEYGANPGNRTGVLHNPDFWNYNTLSIDSKEEFNWNVIGTPSDKYDSQLDLYQFNLLGGSGRFVIIKENGVLVPKLLSRDQNVKIELSHTSTYKVDSFTITDANGYKYIFNVIEDTTSTPVGGLVPQGNNGGTIPEEGIGAIVQNRSAWHLHQIKTSNDIVLATFSYTSILHTYTSSITRTYNTITNSVTNAFLENPYNQNILRPKQSLTSYTTQVNTQKPSSIVFKDNTRVDFTIATQFHPETNGAILNDVIIKDENNLENMRYKFIYSTVNTRLWLDRVDQVASGQVLNYKISYYNKNITPFDGLSDDWGYTTGSSNAIKSGLVTKIEYPTRGSKDFEFEPHTFAYTGDELLPNQNTLGGGIRIKNVLFKEDTGAVQKKVSYTYIDPSSTNRSSGVVDGIYGNLTKKYTTTLTKYLYTGSETSSNFIATNTTYDVESKEPNVQLTKGGYVGYEYVQMFEDNNGETRYAFTTAKDYPSPDNVFTYPYKPAPNIDFKRGLLLKQEVFNNANQKLKEVTNTYNYIEDVIAPSFTVIDEEQCVWSQFYNRYSSYKNKIANQNQGNLTVFWNCGTPTDKKAYTDNLTATWAQLTQTVNKDYLYDANNVQSVVDSRQTFTYNTTNFQQSVVNNYVKEKGVEEHYKTELFYPVGGYPSADYNATEQAAITKMVTLNKINTPIYIKAYKNNVLQTKTQSVFKEFYTNLVELEKVKTAVFTGALEERIVYKSYYNDGNVREVSKTNGATTVYIWGYNTTLPVAKIDNATYSQVQSIGSVPLGLSSNQENTLRGLSNVLVSTYTYKPVVGMTSTTDPKGYKMTYEYDNFNRLEFVRDQDGKVLSKNVYNYKN